MVAAPAAQLAAADARQVLLLRQLPRRHGVGVVHAAGDDRVVRIAIQEVDDHLHADARHGRHAEGRAGPCGGHAHPAAGVLVVLPDAVPVELHLDAAVLVGPDLLAGRADDHRGLRATRARLVRGAQRAPCIAGGLGIEGEALHRAFGAVRAFAGLQVLLQVVAHAEQQVLLVLVGLRMAGQPQGVSGGELAQVGAAGDAAALAQLFFVADARIGLAVAVLHEAAGPLVVLVVVVVMAGRHLPQVGELGLGLLEVVVVVVVVAGAHLFGDLPRVDALALAHAGLLERVIAHLLAAGQRAVRAGDVVGEHEHVLRGLVPEVVVDALEFAQARDEGEVALVVLHAVVPAAVVAAGELLLDGMAVASQHVRQDVGNALALEDAKVAAPRGQPEPRPQPQPVEGMARVFLFEAEARGNAAQVAHAAALGLHRHGGDLAQQGLRLDGVVAAQQIDVERIELAQRLSPHQLAKLQRLAQRRLDRDAAAHCRAAFGL
jgi:hypothetical protein